MGFVPAEAGELSIAAAGRHRLAGAEGFARGRPCPGLWYRRSSTRRGPAPVPPGYLCADETRAVKVNGGICGAVHLILSGVINTAWRQSPCSASFSLRTNGAEHHLRGACAPSLGGRVPVIPKALPGKRRSHLYGRGFRGSTGARVLPHPGRIASLMS